MVVVVWWLWRGEVVVAWRGVVVVRVMVVTRAAGVTYSPEALDFLGSRAVTSWLVPA